jgi:hypothetical protein
MHSFILQDWTTIRGGVATVIQGEADWLDLSSYQDCIFFLDVREASGTPTITFQTSPTKDEALFQTMITATLMTASATGAAAIKATLTNAIVPVARFVRWQINGTITWDSTFRVIVAANSPGM